MSSFEGLDRALRWLRLQAQRKQRDVAQAAGITQAMLCAYEQGKRVPTLKSLARILDTLGTTFMDFAVVLAQLRGDPPPTGGFRTGFGSDRPAATVGPDLAAGRVPIAGVLAGGRKPTPAQEAALQKMLDVFCDRLRDLNDVTEDMAEDFLAQKTKTR